jgi:GTP cyclohydrolase I
MKDIQNQPDFRNIPIDKVGVKDLRYPITVLDRTNKIQQTIGSINMYVNLPHHFRGTHMSRFIEILNEYHHSLHIDTCSEILRKMKQKLHAEEAHIEVNFPYFIEKHAPVSKSAGLMEYQCSYLGTLREEEDFIIGVQVPVTSLCPCSKEIAEYGAHNQRSIIKIKVRYLDFIWFEELIEIAETSASSQLYSLLKRVDEQYVTQYAYENPMFVEDIVRAVAQKLDENAKISWYQVEAENFESIHNHNAYAAVEKKISRSDST